MTSRPREPGHTASSVARPLGIALVMLLALTWAHPALPAPVGFGAGAAPRRVAGDLDSVRSQAHGTGGSSGGSSTSSSSDDEPENGLVLAVGQVVVVVATIIVLAPFVVPHFFLQDDWRREGYYAPAPYVKSPAYMQATYDPARDPYAMSRVWLGAASAEWTPVSSDLDRYGGWVRLEGPLRFGLDLRGSLLQERTASGEQDQLGFVAGNLTYRFAESPRLQFRTGLGVRGLIDHGWSEGGVDFLYATEWMPRSPWVVSMVLQGGSLGSTGVFEPRVTLGCTTHGWQLDAGYAWSKVGSVDLSGPVVGLRRWY